MRINYGYSPVEYEESIGSDVFPVPTESYVIKYRDTNCIDEVLYDTELSAAKKFQEININSIIEINKILDEELYDSNTGIYFADESDISSAPLMINQDIEFQKNSDLTCLDIHCTAENENGIESPKDIIKNQYYILSLFGSYICYTITLYLLAYVFPGIPKYHNYSPEDMHRLLLIAHIMFIGLAFYITLHHYSRSSRWCECFFIYNIVLVELALMFIQTCTFAISFWNLISIARLHFGEKHEDADADFLDAYQFRSELVYACGSNILALLLIIGPISANIWMRHFF